MEGIIDITQQIYDNDNKLRLHEVRIFYRDDILIQGWVYLNFGGKKLRALMVFALDKNTEASRKADALLSKTYIKNGGYGIPSHVDLIIDNKFVIIDLIGENTQVGNRPCSFCGERWDQCKCTSSSD